MKRLKDVPSDKAFMVNQGGPIKSLYQLADAFEFMSLSSFKHHVSSTKNDFSNWVADVIDDSTLALKLKSLKTKKQMENAVRTRITELEHELLPANASKNILKMGMVDFVIGLVIGLVAGLIIASFL